MNFTSKITQLKQLPQWYYWDGTYMYHMAVGKTSLML